jgi:protein-histidine pros-kinase
MDLTDNAKAILDATPDAIVIVDEAGNTVFANTQAEVLFGYREGRLIGRDVGELIPQRYRAKHVTYRSAFTKGAKVRPMQSDLGIIALRSDGTEFPVEISLSSVPTEHGTFVCSAIRDVTDRKAIEDALRVARDEAERANRAKSVLLSVASHDLRQPLQTLNILNAILAKNASDSIAETIAQQAEVLDAMGILLDGLLNIGKLESGAIRPDIVDCELQAIFRRLRAEFEPQAENKGLTFSVDTCDDMVRTDPVLLEQILQNLIANAISYTEHGSVCLRCRSNESVRIEVIDTGMGIPDDQVEAIFEEFYQLDREPGKGDGLGLGLSIVRRFAELLDHPVRVESTLGEGTCFSVTVPRSDRDADWSCTTESMSLSN